MEPKAIFGSRQDNAYSSQSSRKLISSAVKTPALLFYKPNVNTAKKSKADHDHNHFGEGAKASNTRNEPLERVCQNHQFMGAKFFSKTDEGQQIFYCDKCAHLLKDQGFEIFPFSLYVQGAIKDKALSHKNVQSQKKHGLNYPFPERQREINDFLASLEQVREELDEDSNQVRQILINSQQFYGQQIEEINEYFQTIIQSLELEKNKCYNHILQERQNAQKEARSLVKRLGEGQREIGSMMADIEENLDSVYSISWQNYKLVMDTFEGRLSEITRLLSEIREKGLAEVEYRKIEFAGVPESINSLSEIIIQNSYGSAHYTDGSLLLTQGSNESLKRVRELQSISGNAGEHSIFQKLRTDHSEDQARNARHLMFSFDGQRMREFENQNSKISKQNYNLNVCHPDQNDIKLRKNKSYGSGAVGIEKVAGIKEVQQIDVLVMDDDEMAGEVGGWARR